MHGPAVVLDTGSSEIRAGIAEDEDEGPSAIIASGVGKRGGAKPKYLLERGIITDWEGMVAVWNEVFFNDLSVVPEECSILLTESPLNPKANREYMLAIMFESFEFQAAFVVLGPLLSLFAAGRTTGIVVDCGYSTSLAVPIYDSYLVAHAVMEMDMGGRDLTEHMVKLLMERSYDADVELAGDVKEAMCYVALDFDEEMRTAAESSALEKTWEMEDGNTITIGEERFRCPEVLFQPSLIGKETDGIADITYHSIMKCDAKSWPTLLGNVVLAGGSTLFSGFPDRLSKELTDRAPSSTAPKVAAERMRKYSAWVGGAFLSTLSSFSWISRMEYETEGPEIVHRKCLSSLPGADT
mmetsp:Transcript_63040/g.148041  ORF Transcript_63040/g.148041 Transcript_63040/m.148041 type:complete len:354 (+) Transcript_63040:98-1159(+)